VRGEQTRARYPDESGYAEHDGVRVYYEAYGTGEPAILFLPTWEIVHSRSWKFQIPYFARHGRVVTFDRRGNGRSGRPAGVAAYDRRAAVGDALAVLEKVHAGRVRNRHYFLRDWPGFAEFFFTQTFTEPHSTKPTEDAIGWALETDPETIVRGLDAEWTNDRETVLRLGAQVRCPILVIQGSQDAVVGPARGAAVAGAIPRAQLLTLEGSGHAPHLRDPVMTNLLIRRFVSGLA
jgi:pimeloyl-ACP methyl ester carboxylesterase